ncbi:MAG: hypothetical protein JNN24_01550 [Hyphomicrobium zavarzinii]|uniref:hypothetical protein n=1 Tax=Hyphomicrobium zavarzinii TaxID=48292 RepID=UPI001A575DFD|nr:hypothetical protein [Hyphomicrobium zavarzinii]MBL8844430.1 hypothetical protein [Hyphomicrobium zavarzinii]
MKKPERGSGWIEVSSSGLPTAARFQNPTRHEPQVAPFRITTTSFKPFGHNRVGNLFSRHSVLGLLNPLKLTNFPVLVSS